MIAWIIGHVVADCVERKYDQDSFVCVCNANQCDVVEPIYNIGTNMAAIYTTSKDEDRLTKSAELFGTQRVGSLRARIFPNKKFQKIVGFGGAITDAAMIVLDKLRKSQKDSNDCKICKQLTNQYYGPNGISYTLGRVNLGSLCLNSNTTKLLFFAKLIEKSNGNLKLFASPWSAPAWMKTSGQMKGGGELKGEPNGIYYLTFARYFIRFFEEYHKEGVDFWGLTLINEPGAGKQPDYRWQAMYISPDQQREFVDNRLGPMLRKHWLTKDIKIMAHDDQRDNLFEWAKSYYKNPDTLIDGLGVHWYSQSSYDTLEKTHNLRPDKFILPTEACNAYLPNEQEPLLGSWYYAERYAQDIINNLLNYAAGWTDWNIWLNEFGGPNWVGNFVDSPIIVNITGQEFYKQPMYYVIGHFSKFILPDSERIQIKVDGFEGKETDDLQAVAFSTPNGYNVVVLHNRNSLITYNLALGVGEQPSSFVPLHLKPKSIQTVILKS
ncbi:Glucosylceramidase [Aphelenchoides bicaudatus]|nr:Glucosylceramidase [Aphelenchoides bicaudatus]